MSDSGRKVRFRLTMRDGKATLLDKATGERIPIVNAMFNQTGGVHPPTLTVTLVRCFELGDDPGPVSTKQPTEALVCGTRRPVKLVFYPTLGWVPSVDNADHRFMGCQFSTQADARSWFEQRHPNFEPVFTSGSMSPDEIEAECSSRTTSDTSSPRKGDNPDPRLTIPGPA